MLVKVNDKGFVYDSDDPPVWLPPINPRQFELFNDFHRYVLIDGPRKSSKTYGIIHKVIRHAFDVDGAMFGIVNKTLKNAKSSGVWTLLSNWMLPFWERGLGDKWEPWMPVTWKYGCPGFKVVEGPKTTGDTKLSYVRIRSRNGGVSEIQCHSLEHSKEVEAKFKGPFYSGFWLSEFDQFCDRHAFDIFCDALRMPGVKYGQHQILCDCNPPESGENNWQHDLWFKERNNPKVDDPDYDPIFISGLQRIQFTIEHNPQLDDNERRDLVARYRKRKGLYKRFILGEWVQDITNGHFADVWDEATHVRGNIDCSDDEREILVPSHGCTTLLTGWDIGASKNHSFHILEKLITEDPSNHKMIISFSVLDELVVINKQISVEQFTEEAMALMDKWSKFVKKRDSVELRWRHWSDSSAFQYRSTANTTDAAMVYQASNGKVILDAAPKYRNSNRDKVKLLWQLLYDKRMVVSAQLGVTRAMFANLRSGGAGEFVREDEHKHPFDTISYPILAEAPLDMIKGADATQQKIKEVERVVVSL